MDEYEWMRDAACRGIEPTLFHPAVLPGRRPTDGPRMEQVNTAKRICDGCPVKEPCRKLGHGAPGIWGGEDEWERVPPGMNKKSNAWVPKGVKATIDAVLVDAIRKTK